MEYRCEIKIRYPSWVTADNAYDAKEKAKINLGYTLLKNGLVDYIDDILCKKEE